MPIALSDLFTPLTREEIEESILSVAASLGLAVTAWQPLGVARTIIASISQKAADFTEVLAAIASGGLLDYATGGWLDLLVQSTYNLERIAATFASGTITITNASASPYTYNVGDLHVAHVTSGKTYTNTSSGTVSAGTSITLNIRADEAGASSTAGPGSITVQVTPQPGVTVTNSISLVGADAEIDEDYRQRARDKLQALSPNGPAGAYAFFAKTQADGKTPLATSVPITRVEPVADPLTGFVYVRVANAAGAVSAPDLAIVDANIQLLCVPLGVTAIVESAVELLVPITGTLYVKATSSLTDGQVISTVGAQLATYFKTIPIGGFDGAVLNQIPIEAIIGHIFRAIVDVQDVVLTAPVGDVLMSATDVAVLDTVTLTVVRV